jgi:malate synthase
MAEKANIAKPGGTPIPAGLEVLGHYPGQDELLIPEALTFLAKLHRRFESERQDRLAARRARQAQFDAGALPGFREDTRAIREGDWHVAAIPEALLDRRVEITGPVDPKMVINALNSGAQCYMADFEDSTAPTWANLMIGQRALRDAVAGALKFDAPAANGAPGKSYRLKPYAEQAVLLVRPRGWHLDEKHVRIDGARMSASLFDIGLFAFHNAGLLAAEERGPYFYLPKLQCMEEAQLWDAVLGEIEQSLGLEHGQMKVTVLIETLPAAFEMDEILYAARSHRRFELRALGLHFFLYQNLARASRPRAARTRASDDDAAVSQSLQRAVD